MNCSIRSRISHRVAIALIVIVVAALATQACGGGSDDDSSPTSPSVNVPYSQTDLRVGTGAEATAGRRVSVNYTGWLYEQNAAENKGRQFDTSAGRGPFAFTIGAREVIQGWDQGVAGMRVGGQRRLVIPPALGYGSQGSSGGVIPPNATLIFDIELIAIQ